jgi:hypothetical protein
MQGGVLAIRPELLEASDQEIDDAVLCADPMVLRGLLFQITGDESIAATETVPSSYGFLTAKSVAGPADAAVLQSKAAGFLKSYRDQGAGGIPIGSQERLQRSLGLTAGEDIPGRDMPTWKSAVDVTLDGYCRYDDEVDKAEATRIYVRSGVNNYWTNEYGRSATNYPFDARKMWEWLRDPTGRYADSAPGESINAGSLVRPYFGPDLIVE